MSLSSSIAIDGPAGSGKSTIAKMLSKATGLPYLSTGEMYRAVALYVLRKGIDPYDEPGVFKCATEARISAVPDGFGGFRIKCGEEDVTALLRSAEVSRLSSLVAIHPSVRKLMVSVQRRIAIRKSLIMDGRDIGTVVLKESRNKVFLKASEEARAKRRLSDYKAQGLDITYEVVLRELKERDLRDSTRLVDPLHPVADSLVIDTSDMTPEQVLDAIIANLGLRRGGVSFA